MTYDRETTKTLERYIRLLKKGDAPSLKQLRTLLSKTQSELALKIGVSEHKLELWEMESQRPTGLQRARWKIKLASYVDEEIKTALNMQDNEIIFKFWALIWGLVD
jgi:DNA-binding XRE family transcriptional regulator